MAYKWRMYAVYKPFLFDNLYRNIGEKFYEFFFAKFNIERVLIMSQTELRQKLIATIEAIGLKSKTICEKTRIGQPELSRFKHSKADLYKYQVEVLDKYLDEFKDML